MAYCDISRVNAAIIGLACMPVGYLHCIFPYQALIPVTWLVVKHYVYLLNRQKQVIIDMFEIILQNIMVAFNSRSGNRPKMKVFICPTWHKFCLYENPSSGNIIQWMYYKGVVLILEVLPFTLEVKLFPRIKKRIPVGHKSFWIFPQSPIYLSLCCENIGADMPNAAIANVCNLGKLY